MSKDLDSAIARLRQCVTSGVVNHNTIVQVPPEEAKALLKALGLRTEASLPWRVEWVCGEKKGADVFYAANETGAREQATGAFLRGTFGPLDSNEIKITSVALEGI